MSINSDKQTHDTKLLFHPQIKERLRRRINTIFPRANDETHARKTSQFNRSDVGAVKKIEVQPCSNSVFELKQY